MNGINDHAQRDKPKCVVQCSLGEPVRFGIDGNRPRFYSQFVSSTWVSDYFANVCNGRIDCVWDGQRSQLDQTSSVRITSVFPITCDARIMSPERSSGLNAAATPKLTSPRHPAGKSGIVSVAGVSKRKSTAANRCTAILDRGRRKRSLRSLRKRHRDFRSIHSKPYRSATYPHAHRSSRASMEAAVICKRNAGSPPIIPSKNANVYALEHEGRDT
jgi:hypothetical protein